MKKKIYKKNYLAVEEVRRDVVRVTSGLGACLPLHFHTTRWHLEAWTDHMAYKAGQ